MKRLLAAALLLAAPASAQAPPEQQLGMQLVIGARIAEGCRLPYPPEAYRLAREIEAALLALVPGPNAAAVRADIAASLEDVRTRSAAAPPERCAEAATQLAPVEAFLSQGPGERLLADLRASATR